MRAQMRGFCIRIGVDAFVFCVDLCVMLVCVEAHSDVTGIVDMMSAAGVLYLYR